MNLKQAVQPQGRQGYRETQRRAQDCQAIGLLDAAVRDWTETLTVAKQVFGVDDWRVRDAVVRLEHANCMLRLPSPQYVQAQRLQLLYKRALGRQYAGDYGEALHAAEEAQRLSRQLFGGSTIQNFDVLGTIGNIHSGIGDNERAADAYQEQFLLGEQLLGKEHLGTVLALSYLGETMTATRQFYGAEKLLRWSLDATERVYERNKEDEDVREYYASCCRSLAVFHIRASEAEKAVNLYLRACELWPSPPKSREDVHAVFVVELAWAELEKGDAQEAVRTASRGLELVRACLGPQHPNYGRALTVLAAAAVERGDLEGAARRLDDAERVLRRGDERPDAAPGEVVEVRARLCRKLGRAVEAQVLLASLLTAMERRAGAEHPMLRRPLRDLAMLKRAAGQEAEAQSLERHADRIEATLSEYKRTRTFDKD